MLYSWFTTCPALLLNFRWSLTYERHKSSLLKRTWILPSPAICTAVISRVFRTEDPCLQGNGVDCSSLPEFTDFLGAPADLPGVAQLGVKSFGDSLWPSEIQKCSHSLGAEFLSFHCIPERWDILVYLVWIFSAHMGDRQFGTHSSACSSNLWHFKCSVVPDMSQLIFWVGLCYSETRGGYQVGRLGTNLHFRCWGSSQSQRFLLFFRIG